MARAITASPTAASRDAPSAARTAASLYLSSDWARPTFVSMTPDLVADLSHNALLAVTGDDAGAFLHAQFTNDVQALDADEAQWNGWCTAKGRLLATFLLLRRAEGYLLMLPAEIAAPVASAVIAARSRSRRQSRSTFAEAT